MFFVLKTLTLTTFWSDGTITRFTPLDIILRLIRMNCNDKLFNLKIHIKIKTSK